MNRDPWFPIALLLVILLGAWLGAFGPAVDAVSARGLFSVLKEWQTLVSAIIAFGAVGVAWINVSRQLKFNAVKAEEERLENVLPALHQAVWTLNPVQALVAGDASFLNYDDDPIGFNTDWILSGIEPLKAEVNEDSNDLARRLFPNLDDKTRRDMRLGIWTLSLRFAGLTHLQNRIATFGSGTAANSAMDNYLGVGMDATL